MVSKSFDLNYAGALIQVNKKSLSLNREGDFFVYGPELLNQVLSHIG